MTKKSVKLFFRFLKEQSVFSSYLKNFKNSAFKNKYFMIKSFNADKIHDLEILNFSFYWAETSEGDRFWRNLSKLYKEYYYQNIDSYNGAK